MIIEHPETVANNRQIAAYLRQHHTDIQRLIKRMADFAQSQMGEDSPGGTGITGASTTGKSIDQRWFPFVNNAGSTASAYGILRVTGASYVSGVGVQLTVDQSNTYGSQFLHAVNSDAAVAASGTGWCTMDLPTIALYDTGDGTPTAGQVLGPRSGSWKLRSKTGGFRVIAVLDSTNGYALVNREPMLTVKGKTTGAWAVDASQAIDVWWGTDGSETAVSAGSVQVTAWNRWAAIATGKVVRLNFNPDSGTFEMIDGKC